MSTTACKVDECDKPVLPGTNTCSNEHAEEYVLFVNRSNLFSDDYSWATELETTPNKPEPAATQASSSSNAEQRFIEQSKRDAHDLPCGDSCGS